MQFYYFPPQFWLIVSYRSGEQKPNQVPWRSFGRGTRNDFSSLNILLRTGTFRNTHIQFWAVFFFHGGVETIYIFPRNGDFVRTLIINFPSVYYYHNGRVDGNKERKWLIQIPIRSNNGLDVKWVTPSRESILRRWEG